MQKVAYKLQAIRKIHEELLEVQKKCFRMEIKRVTGKLKQIKEKSARLKIKIGFLKIKKQTLSQQLDRNALAIKKN